MLGILAAAATSLAAEGSGTVKRPDGGVKVQKVGATDTTTVFEKSGGLRTGRYDEVERLCAAFVQAYPGQAKCTQFGVSAEGRPMMALVVSADGTLEPIAAKKKHRPVILFQGGIHAGEIDGKDAGFLLIRELLDGSAARKDESLGGALSKMTLVFIPVLNVDGHERFGSWNRPNQVGPEEMGWRTTAQNLNLNRDYTKADTPEMQALLRLLDEWDPAVYLDLHVTDGAQFQHDISVLVSPERGESPLAKAGAALSKAVGERLVGQKHLPLMEFYPSLVKEDDPSSGFAVGDAPPRFSHSYWASRNRLGILVETHSWKPYALRVSATHDTLLDVIAEGVQNGAGWLTAESNADDAGLNTPGSEVVLAADHGTHFRTIDFLGVAYTRGISDVSGGNWIRYDPSKPEVWKIPLYDEIVSVLVAKAPLAGYVIPAAFAPVVAERLRLHGISFTTLPTAREGLEVETFRATKAILAPQSFEGRTQVKLEGNWMPERRDLPAGSLYVPVAQPRGSLAVQLLEPKGPDSFAAWGFFNACFEQKEYMETYVAEQLARDMMARDPALKAEFEKKVASDAQFAKSPSARLDFFFRRSPSWDERLNLVPVYRVGREP
jgi:hypothetical protein